MLNASLQDHPDNLPTALPGPDYRFRILMNWVNGSRMANNTDSVIRQVQYGFGQGDASVLDRLIDYK
jgi:hypothetical protein